MTVQKYLDDDGHVSDAGMNEAIRDYLNDELDDSTFNDLVEHHTTGEAYPLGPVWEIEQLLAPDEVGESAESWAGLVTVRNAGTDDGTAVLRVDDSVADRIRVPVGESARLSWSIPLTQSPGETREYTLNIGDISRRIDVTRTIPESGVFILDHDPRSVTLAEDDDLSVRVTVSNHSDTLARRWLFVDYFAEPVEIPAGETETVVIENVLSRLNLDIEAGTSRRVPITLQPTKTAVRSDIEDRATVLVWRE